MARPGPRNDLTDVNGLAVGQAEDGAAATGVTLVLAEEPAVAAVDVRGGGPGTRETDALRPGGLVERADAIVLAGGSVYGLAAADAVCAGLGARGRGFGLIDQPGVPRSPIVPAAILFDLANGGDKGWGVAPPYARLGAEALAAALETPGPVALGACGAGYGARAGLHPGGTGAASLVTEDGFTLGALACVNSFGSVYMPGTRCFWAWPFEIEHEFGGVRPPPDYKAHPEDWGDAKINPAPRANTSLAVIATDAALSRDEARRLAVMAQDGFARAIRPAHAPFDGDVVFALSTGARPLGEGGAFTLARLGSLAADTLARAVARGVHAAAHGAPD